MNAPRMNCGIMKSALASLFRSFNASFSPGSPAKASRVSCALSTSCCCVAPSADDAGGGPNRTSVTTTPAQVDTNLSAPIRLDIIGHLLLEAFGTLGWRLLRKGFKIKINLTLFIERRLECAGSVHKCRPFEAIADMLSLSLREISNLSEKARQCREDLDVHQL